MAWRVSSSPRKEVAGMQPGGAGARRSVQTRDGWHRLLLLFYRLLLLGGGGERKGPVVHWMKAALPQSPKKVRNRGTRF